MRSKTVLVFVVSLLASLPYAAQAQDKKVNFSFGGGYTQPNAEVSDRLGGGFNFNLGLQVNVTPVVAIEGLYSFNGFGDKQLSIPIAGNPGGSTVPTDLFGDMNMQYGTASLIVKSPSRARVRPYGLTGLGVYYRPVTVTTPGVGFVPGFCSPWYYYCVPGGFVPVDNVVGDRSSTDFGMVFGAGVDIAASDAASVYVEFRYHYIWGPEINPSEAATLTGTTGKTANGQFLPFTIGIRF